MSAKSDKAAKAVAALFAKKPAATLDDYLAVAERADKSLKGIARRSFNAIYILPLKRAAVRAAGKSTRKKAAPKKATTKTRAREAAAAKPAARRKARRKVRRRRRATATGGDRSAARRLVLERDQAVISTLGRNGDPRQAYDLAAGIDEYLDRLAAALKG